MQCSGGGGNGAFFPREHRLVIIGIARIGGALGGDIRGQGHPADPVEQQLDGLFPQKIEREAAIRTAVAGDGYCIVTEFNDIAIVEPSGITDEGTPPPWPFALMERRADAGIAAPPFELGGDHPGIVEHQQVAGVQQSREFIDDAIVKASRRNRQQPSRVARRGRPKRDAVGGQVEIKQIHFHGEQLSAMTKNVACDQRGVFFAAVLALAGAGAGDGAFIGKVTGAPRSAAGVTGVGLKGGGPSAAI